MINTVTKTPPITHKLKYSLHTLHTKYTHRQNKIQTHGTCNVPLKLAPGPMFDSSDRSLSLFFLSNIKTIDPQCISIRRLTLRMSFLKKNTSSYCFTYTYKKLILFSHNLFFALSRFDLLIWHTNNTNVDRWTICR